jgi:UPF0716 protein FxsA
VVGLLALLFLVVPIAELYVIVQVAGSLGVLNTLGLLVLSSIVGAWLARREGLGLLRRIQEQLQRGQLPANEVVDGTLILFAGALMVAPGFLTDLLAIVLLLPPTRALIRIALLRRFRHRIEVRTFGTVGRPSGAERPVQRGPGAVYDADSWERQ